MRVAAGLIALLVAACSPVPGDETPGAEERGGGASQTTPPRTAPSAATGDRMTGRVSDLGASISDLTVRITDQATVVDLPTDTLFAFDSAVIDPSAAGNLAKVAELVGRGAPGPVTITGHSDAKGEDAYNLRLSEARAAAVAAWLRARPGLAGRTFTVIGKGEASPIAANARPDGSDDPEGRARNRRVEIAIPR